MIPIALSKRVCVCVYIHCVDKKKKNHKYLYQILAVIYLFYILKNNFQNFYSDQLYLLTGRK